MMVVAVFCKRLSVRVIGGMLASSVAPLSVQAQQANTPTELPAVEVTATAKAKKTVAKKSQVKTSPKSATTAQPATTAPSQAPTYTGVTNGSGPVKDYVASTSTAGTKTDTPLKETPQSISVVGQEQMRDQGVQNLQEAIRYVPGVLADGFGYDSRGDFSLIRGTQAAYYVDGLRTNYGYFVNTAGIEPYAVQRVEVLRGPSSMLYGQTPTGGIVNVASKIPSEIPYNEITAEYGSFDFKQVKFDSTGALTKDGKWLYRVVGLARDADTQVDYVENDRLMLAPSLTYRPTNDTSITVLGNFRDDHSGTTQQFMPFVGDTAKPLVARSAFLGEPDDNYDTEQQSGSLLIDHRFSEGLKLHHASRYTHTENEYVSSYPAVMTPFRIGFLNSVLPAPLLDPATAPFLDPAHTLVARAHFEQQSETDVINSDTNMTAIMMTGDVGHKITGGFDYMRWQQDMRTSGTLIDNIWAAGQPGFNIYDPQYGQSTFYLALGGPPVLADAVPLNTVPQVVQSQAGLYIQDQLKWGPWRAVLGLRHDWLTMEQVGTPDRKEEATTGRAALMYEFGFGLTPYISYSTSFSPQTNIVGDNIYTPFTQQHSASPLEGEQVEVGFKYQPNGLPFMINGALYDLSDKNRIVQPDVIATAVQGSDISVRGFEIEAVGKVTRDLKIIGSYSYTDATYDKYPEVDPVHPGLSDYMAGRRVEWIPKHLASLWAVYTVNEGFFTGLSFGSGVRYVGSTESFGIDVGSGTELYVKTPSYTVYDAMVAYETKDWRWQLTAQNLEDKYYLTTCSAFRGDCGVGQARTIITGLTYKF